MILSATFTLAVILAVTIILFVLKLPAGLCIIGSGLAGTLVSGMGLPLSRFVEGSFGFFYIIMVFGSGMILVKVMSEIGFMDSVQRLVLVRLGRQRALLLLSIMFLLMLPGMLTGIGAVAVVSTGALAAPVLLRMGIPKRQTAVMISMGAILGMIAPPINIPLMGIGAILAIPYEGFTLVCLILTVPLAILFALGIGLRYAQKVELDELLREMPDKGSKDRGFLVYLPIIVVIALMFFERVVPHFPHLSLPLILMLGAVMGLFSMKGRDFFRVSSEALSGPSFHIIMILIGVGIVGEVVTMAGVRGLLATFFFTLPDFLFYPSLASFPLLGSLMTVFGSTFVLGFPFVLSMLPKSAIITGASLSLIAGLSDVAPPTALSGNLAAGLVGEKTYLPILVRCLIPGIITIIWAIVVILMAPYLAKLIL